VLDALHLMRSALYRFDDMRLDTVARTVLGRGKTLHADDGEDMPAAIARAYAEDRGAFVTYCLEDARLVRDILAKTDLVQLTLRRSLLIGLPLQRAWSSVAAFEFLYLTELRRLRMVAPTMDVDRNGGTGAPGGLVLAPAPGLYQHVLVFDFKSLYPSIIRTFRIDPLAAARAPQDDRPLTAPNGQSFHRDAAVLPEILDRFFASREAAKAAGDTAASLAYKLVMNSFYGVLGTGACRFGTSRLAGAITGIGHQLMHWLQDWFNARGTRVLYGDTDSMFVVADVPATSTAEAVDDLGRQLCAEANTAVASFVSDTYDVESRLELEFEKHYLRFLLPASRGDAERGRAKGYAGLRADSESVEIIGMEAVRRDWTALAHRVQRELLALVFADTDREAIEAFISEVVAAIAAGQCDDELVYIKGLRKDVDAYTRTTPPHVKAARQLAKPGAVIRYLMTTDGPQPEGQVRAPLDYRHYIDKQVSPIVRAIAPLAGVDPESSLTGQPTLF
jgi:DNA polymerase-2